MGCGSLERSSAEQYLLRLAVKASINSATVTGKICLNAQVRQNLCHNPSDTIFKTVHHKTNRCISWISVDFFMESLDTDIADVSSTDTAKTRYTVLAFR